MNQKQKDKLIATISILSLAVSIIWFLSEPKFESLMLVLSTMATSLTLYSTKGKIEKIELQYIIKPRKLFKTSVAIWGPTRSGKSWLIRAFAKTIVDKYKGQFDGLTYSLEKISLEGSRPLSSQFLDVADISPTAMEESFIYKFERQRTDTNFAHSISSFTHELNLIDMRGADLIDSVLRPEKHEDTLSVLADADVILIALDPLFEKTENLMLVDDDAKIFDEEYSELALRPGINAKQYTETIEKLLHIIDSLRPDKQRYYAVCLMKSDTLFKGSFYYNPTGLIERYFGKKMVDILKSVDPKYLQTFVVSSAGFLKIREIISGNFSNGRLLDSDSWKPYQVEHPFFWAFEQIEMGVLREQFSKTWWSKLTINSKLKKYIHYPKLKYELPLYQDKNIDDY